MKRVLFLFLYINILFIFSSCFDEDKYSNSKKDNFELLWKIMNEHYCFFEYKDIDWNEIHNRYADRIREEMTDEALFDVFSEMLAEVQDGHVNLYANHNVARYWKWFEDYPDNFDEKIQRNYIGTDYMIAGGMKYTVFEDNIGYIYYASFSNGVGESNLNQILSRMAICDGIIIDVRSNGGGILTNAEKIAARFFDAKTHVGYIMYKSGKGHSDFSQPHAKYIEPSDLLKFQKKVIVLTNRRCYSAANYFVNVMRYSPYVTIVGDRTGGGGGLPMSSELSNGWSVRFSSSPMLSAEHEQIEFGIDPDVKVDMSDEDMSKGIDTIIERARILIKES